MTVERERPRVAILLLVALTAAGCAKGASDPQAEAERLMETSREWARAARSGDLDAIVRYWGDDATLLMPGQPVSRGKDQIRASVEASFKTPGFAISWEPLEAHVSRSGDMGYLLERTQLSMSDGRGGTSTQQLRAVTIWRKQPDGDWKNVVDISNAGPTP